MAILKPIAGHGNLVENNCRDYMLGIGKWESKYHGNRCSKITYINIPPDRPGHLSWDERMDQDRITMGTNIQLGKDPVCTYKHYIFSPNPKDNVNEEQLDSALCEWAERVFQNKFSIVICYHNDNKNRVQHAHMYINNVNWCNEDSRSRISRYTDIKCWEYASQLWQYMCKERGWFSFIEKQQSDLDNKKLIDAGDYESILKHTTKETKRLFDIDENYFKKYKYFNREVDYKRPFRYVKNTKDEYVTKPPFSTKYGRRYTKSAQEAKNRGEHLWTDDIRSLIEIAYWQTDNIGDFVNLLNKYDVKVQLTKDKDFKYTHPENQQWAVTGKKLGHDYSRARIIAQFTKQKNGEINKFCPNKKQYDNIVKAISNIGYSLNVGHISLKDKASKINIHDVAKTMRICSEYNVWDIESIDKFATDNTQIKENIEFAKSNLEKLNTIEEIRKINEPEKKRKIIPLTHKKKSSLHNKKNNENKTKKHSFSGQSSHNLNKNAINIKR